MRSMLRRLELRWLNAEKRKGKIMDFLALTQADYDLIQEALAVLAEHFDPGVYHHTVGCAVRCKNGNIYRGVNCDGIHGSCAEYITIGNAICAGERELDTIVAVHEHAPNKLYAPCGNCRQMLIEYCPDIHVILNDDEGNIRKVCIRDLLPFAWKQAPDF